MQSVHDTAPFLRKALSMSPNHPNKNPVNPRILEENLTLGADNQLGRFDRMHHQLVDHRQPSCAFDTWQ